MAFWNRRRSWEDEYDEYYAQDRLEGREARPRIRYFAHLLLLTLFGALFVGAVGYVSGVTMVEKLLTSLATPVGVVWLGLLLLVYFSLLNRQAWPAWVAAICWLILTVGGNQLVANWFAASLEQPYLEIDPYDGPPLELLVLLGGGTNSSPGGRGQAARNGDRVVVAARLYHAGRTPRIVCTGTQTFGRTEQDRHPREEAVDILLGLGVPESALLEMKGENTFEEIRNLKSWLAERPVEGRVGLVTSAWHLPRVMRLAASQGLELDPIPANFMTHSYQPAPDLVVPTAHNLMKTAALSKECLAAWFGR